MPNTTQIEVSHGGECHSFECFETGLSQGVCRGILDGETYRAIPFITAVKTIVDIGANVGAASVYFALTYPLAEIYAFEPDAASFTLLQRNCARFHLVHLQNIGLFNADCTKILYQGSFDNVTASIKSSALNSTTGYEITLKDAQSALSEIPQPDIVKIDTEGCEVPILYSARNIVSRAKVIYVEYHSESDRKAIDCLLGDTHILFSGAVSSPHRGEFCYVKRDACPTSNELSWLEITP